MSLKFFPFAVVCLLFVVTANAQVVVESQIQVLVGERESKVRLAVDSASPMTIGAKVEFIAPNGSVSAIATENVQLVTGRNDVEISAPVASIINDANFPYYTLRYEIGDSCGSVAVSRLTPQIFDLEAFGFTSLQNGSHYRMRARAVHPVYLRGVGGVQLQGALKVEFEDGRPAEYSVSAATDADGIADMSFHLPPGSRVDEAELKLSGLKNGLRRELTRYVNQSNLTQPSFLYFQTDKPIYQPSQNLSVRTLFFDWNGKALVSEPLIFTIKDPEGTTLQRIETVTSRFGIASVDWAIPESAKLGEYRVVVGSGRELAANERTFKVSRYDLPNFAVSTKTDRDFYLPERNTASVTVRADYLFGKPVLSGKVRVVEESDRQWDFKLQKYTTEEGQVREGELAADGTFTADIELSKHHEDFYEDGRRKFEDIHFAAYVTDLTTNRTEQKRFDIRITRQPIHVYLAGIDDGLSKRFPGRFFVTTFYPDGSPAECDVAIYRADDDDEDKPGRRLLKTKTNRLGAAKVFVPFDSLSDDDDELDLIIAAVDGRGKKGSVNQDLDFDTHKPAVRVITDKVVYRKGDPIQLQVESSEADNFLFVDVARRGEVITSEKLKIAGGRGSIDIPYDNAFKDEITVAVYGSYRNNRGSTETYFDNRTVIYPTARNFTIEAVSDGDTYRPGTEATLKLSAKDQDGIGLETAFGISVIDTAIEERARTDAEFGGHYRSFYSDFEDYIGTSLGYFGLTGQTVNGMDASQKLSPEVELAIEIGITRRFVPDLEDSGNFQDELNTAYKRNFEIQFAPVAAALQRQFDANGTAAIDETSLRAILARGGVDLGAMRDPWGNPFVPAVSISQGSSDVSFTSSGADEHVGTSDDTVALTARFNYFQPTGAAINKAFQSFHARTDAYVRNYKELRDEMKIMNIDLEALRDAWGRKYRFEFAIKGSDLILTVRSGGWDQKVGGYGDFPIWEHRSDYFQVLRWNMGAAFRKHVAETRSFPRDENEFRSVMREKGFDVDKLKDAYRREYYVSKDVIANRATRRFLTESTAAMSTDLSGQQIVAYTIRSAGPDGIRGNADDFDLTRFFGVIAKSAPSHEKNVSARFMGAFRSNHGVIAGVVTDSNGAVIPNASVTIHAATNQRLVSTTRTDDEGRFAVGELAGGTYVIRIDSPGFKALVIESVSIQTGTVADLELTLEVGTVSETVTVVSAGDIDQTINVTGSRISTEFFSNIPTSGMVQGLYTIAPGVSRSGLRDASGRDRDPSVAGSSGPELNVITKSGDTPAGRLTPPPVDTPRLREYFPETLLWLPELVSQANGTAELRIKLADSITKWKVAIIGSTANGDVAVAEKQITAFQPFFVDLDPPKFLTEGDRISLPVQVRNYTSQAQTVDVSMAAANWFSLANAEHQAIGIDPNGTQNAIFSFRADMPVKGGKQRVTAIANNESDAIEKPVTVRPNGREIVGTQSKLFNREETFEIEFPQNAMSKTPRAELKIYPNLFSHVADSVEGLLKRPYGCGEQTISSTYPNLMILKFVKSETPLRRTAQKYLQAGYERLVGYQVADGGFSYWGGKDPSNLALTAYALRFLNDAKPFVAVDEDVLRRAEEYLAKLQRPGGDWGDAATTVYIVRSIAIGKPAEKSVTAAVLQKSMNYLGTRGSAIADPYTLALYGLASLDSGDTVTARSIGERLQKIGVKEGSSTYWNLEGSTLFYGWGTTGRIETTALVVQLLNRTLGPEASAGGTLYLLQNKDRYGVWHSTQTTINVLDAFLAALATVPENRMQKVEVLLNGEVVQTTDVDAGVEALSIDLTGRLNPTSNTLNIRSTQASALMAQVVSSHYIPWQDAPVDRQSDLRLDYKCDKTNVAIMSEISCSVETARVSSRNYGMLLAEIGIPPGADVSRESLERAMLADSSISRYDILPDRIVLYFWSRTGGSKLNFSFRPRYGIDAQTPPSVVYDYYNPEAQTTVAPLRFSVH